MIIRLGSIQDIEKVILQAWYNTRGGGQGLTEQPHVLCQIHLDKFYPDKNHQVSHHKKKKKKSHPHSLSLPPHHSQDKKTHKKPF